MENMQILAAAKDLLACHDPVSHALNQVQSEGSTLATAVHVWLELLSKFPKDASAAVKAQVMQSAR